MKLKEIFSEIGQGVELTRRKFIQSAVTASAATMIGSKFALASVPNAVPVPLGWQFTEDFSVSQEEMAQLVVDTMQKHLDWYQVVDWIEQPTWKNHRSRNNDLVYRLECVPIVAADSTGRPIRKT